MSQKKPKKLQMLKMQYLALTKLKKNFFVWHGIMVNQMIMECPLN